MLTCFGGGIAKLIATGASFGFLGRGSIPLPGFLPASWNLFQGLGSAMLLGRECVVCGRDGTLLPLFVDVV